MNQQIGLFLFSNDLRLDDNPALALAASEVDQLPLPRPRAFFER